MIIASNTVATPQSVQLPESVGVCGHDHNSSVCFEQLNNGGKFNTILVIVKEDIWQWCLRVALLIEEGGSNDGEDA